MAQGIRRPHEAVDFAAIERMYPPPPEYFETAYFEDRDTIERKQLARLIDKAWRTYEVPFHRDRWDAAGFHPSHIKTLDDLWKCPFYTSTTSARASTTTRRSATTKASRPNAR